MIIESFVTKRKLKDNLSDVLAVSSIKFRIQPAHKTNAVRQRLRSFKEHMGEEKPVSVHSPEHGYGQI